MSSAKKHPYAIDYQSDAAGRHIKASKRRVLFRFGFSPDGHTANLEDEHVVTLSWSPTSGKAVLAADGREIHMAGGAGGGGNDADGSGKSGSAGSKKRLLIGSKFEHSWEMAGRTTAAAATAHASSTSGAPDARPAAALLASKSISELKSIAAQRQVDLSGCLEKGDIVTRIAAAAENGRNSDEHEQQGTAAPAHQIRIVAHATRPIGKGSASRHRQFDLFVDGTSYFDLPKCHQLDDGQMGIIGFSMDGDKGEREGEASTTDATSEPPSPGVKGALSQMERGDLQKLLGRIEERKRRGSPDGSTGRRGRSGPATTPTSEKDPLQANVGKTNGDMAILPGGNTEEALRKQSSAEEEIEQLQNRLADLSYLPFLEMIAKDDNADVVRRGGAIAEGEIQRNRKRIAELETIAFRTAMGGAAEDARDHLMAVQEMETLRSRIADLEKIVDGEEAACGGSGSGDKSTPTSNRSASMASLLLPEDQRHLSQELNDDQEVVEPDNEASFLSFLSMMGEQEGEMMRREKEAAEEKANRLKTLIGNLESLADDSSA